MYEARYIMDGEGYDLDIRRKDSRRIPVRIAASANTIETALLQHTSDAVSLS
jgi:hypothetical protein